MSQKRSQSWKMSKPDKVAERAKQIHFLESRLKEINAVEILKKTKLNQINALRISLDELENKSVSYTNILCDLYDITSEEVVKYRAEINATRKPLISALKMKVTHLQLIIYHNYLIQMLNYLNSVLLWNINFIKL